MYPRSFALDVAALMLLAAIVMIMLVLIGHVRADPISDFDVKRAGVSTSKVLV